MGLPSAERRPKLPEAIGPHATGCDRSPLPGSLPGAVLAGGAIYHWVSEASVPESMYSHSSNKQGLPALAHAAPCASIQPLPQS